MAQRLVGLDTSRRQGAVAATVLSLVVTWSVLLVAYFLLGFAGHAAWTALGILVAGGLLFGALLSRQFWSVVGPSSPSCGRCRQMLLDLVLIGLIVGSFLYAARSGLTRHGSAPGAARDT